MVTVRRAQLERLARLSVGIICQGQAPSGAYVASPSFPVYRYSWFRDGAFIADAMSRAGHVDSAEAFFGWCAGILEARRDRIETLIGRRHAGATIDTDEFLHARYTLDGQETGEEWTDFQLDGYGAWLWALDEHRRRHDRSIEPFVAGAALSARYVAAFWDHPSYDWWEEHPDHRHTSTLAAICAGLRAAGRWPELPDVLRAEAARTATAIGETVTTDAHRLGRLAKWLGGNAVDGSLVACSTPFGVLAPDNPLMTATVRQIEVDLVHGGGVHRYAEDTYYGGGEWLLLASLLGWQYQAMDRTNDAWAQLRWVAARSTATGDLPEQVDDHLLAPGSRAAWLDRWGPVATPLLWSHAMYLTLALELGAVRAPVEPEDR
jgi:GH15 family glucan-1,4-alpha-glucosidase